MGSSAGVTDATPRISPKFCASGHLSPLCLCVVRTFLQLARPVKGFVPPWPYVGMRATLLYAKGRQCLALLSPARVAAAELGFTLGMSHPSET